jgi:hypothetical protein
MGTASFWLCGYRRIVIGFRAVPFLFQNYIFFNRKLLIKTSKTTLQYTSTPIFFYFLLVAFWAGFWYN